MASLGKTGATPMSLLSIRSLTITTKENYWNETDKINFHMADGKPMGEPTKRKGII